MVSNIYKLLILFLGIWIGYDLKGYLIQKFYIKMDSLTIALWNGIVNHASDIITNKTKPINLKGQLTAFISSDIEEENSLIQTKNGIIPKSEYNAFDKEFCDILIDNLPCIEAFLKRKKTLGYIINKAYSENIVSDESLISFIKCMMALRENEIESGYIIEHLEERRKTKNAIYEK